MKQKHMIAAALALSLFAGMLPAPVSALTEPIPPYMMNGDSVDFLPQQLYAMFDLIVTGNEEYTVNGCTFTPQEDGRFVVSTRAYCEEIVNFGETGHFHYFYPILTNYTVDVENGEISVKYQGKKSWYSQKQIDEEIEKGISLGDEQPVACYDVSAAQPDDVLNDNLYYTFVNGMLKGDENGYDSYIMNVYDDGGTDSYFCVNYEARDVQLDMNGNEPQRVSAAEMDISSVITNFYTSSSCDGNLELPSPDIMELARIAVPELPILDGGGSNSSAAGASFPLTVIVDDEKSYPLSVEDGIFHHRTSSFLGDCNNDGKLGVTDAVMLVKYLLGVGNLSIPENADLTKDGKINAFDLAVMKRKLTEKPTLPTTPIHETYECKTFDELYDFLRTPGAEGTEVYSKQFTAFKTAMENGDAPLLIPYFNGDPTEIKGSAEWQNITVFTSELYKLPWIWYYCNYDGRCVVVGISYLDYLSQLGIEAPQSISNFMEGLGSNAPNPDNKEKYSENYNDIYYDSCVLANGPVETVVYDCKNGRMQYQFITNDCIVSVWDYEGGEIGKNFWNDFSLQEYTPKEQTTRSLEFEITENVADVDFSQYQQIPGVMGAKQYYGKGYAPVKDEEGNDVKPEHYVTYLVSAYPDYADGGAYITDIEITDPYVTAFGLTVNSTMEECVAAFSDKEFTTEVTEYDDYSIFRAKNKDGISVTLTQANPNGGAKLRINAEVTNRDNIQF